MKEEPMAAFMTCVAALDTCEAMEEQCKTEGEALATAIGEEAGTDVEQLEGTPVEDKAVDMGAFGMDEAKPGGDDTTPKEETSDSSGGGDNCSVGTTGSPLSMLLLALLLCTLAATRRPAVRKP